VYTDIHRAKVRSSATKIYGKKTSIGGYEEMKRRVVSVLLICMLILCGNTLVFANDPGEIDFGQWDSTRAPGAHTPQNPHPADVVGTRYILPVSTLIELGIITGDADGLFYPERTITRAEFAALRARTLREMDLIVAARGDHDFTDFDGFAWAVDYINTAADAGVLTGRGGGIFAPGEQITYAEVITALIRLRPGASQAAQAMGDRWPDNYILFATIHNLVGDITFGDWSDFATRGNVAWLLFRVIPREADDVAELRSIIVNNNAVTLAGRSLSTNLIGTTSANITVNAMQTGNRILIHDHATSVLLAEGIGSVTITLNDLILPHTVRVTIVTGTGATTITTVYTLRLN
jgi:hypothetical protein